MVFPETQETTHKAEPPGALPQPSDCWEVLTGLWCPKCTEGQEPKCTGFSLSLLTIENSNYRIQIFYDYTMKVRNRFKGLHLIDRVPDELWTELHDIVQETGIKTIPMQKKCKKAKWLSEEALQIAVKRREAKSKGEKERYKHLNAEFQRIARRDKKDFLSD